MGCRMFVKRLFPSVWQINVFNFPKSFTHSVPVNAQCLLLLVLWWLVVIGEISHVTFLIQPRKHEQVCLSLMHRPRAQLLLQRVKPSARRTWWNRTVQGHRLHNSISHVQAGAEHNLYTHSWRSYLCWDQDWLLSTRCFYIWNVRAVPPACL